MDNYATLFIVVSITLYLIAFALYVVRGIKGPTVFDSVTARVPMTYYIDFRSIYPSN